MSIGQTAVSVLQLHQRRKAFPRTRPRKKLKPVVLLKLVVSLKLVVPLSILTDLVVLAHVVPVDHIHFQDRLLVILVHVVTADPRHIAERSVTSMLWLWDTIRTTSSRGRNSGINLILRHGVVVVDCDCGLQGNEIKIASVAGDGG